MTTNEDWKAKVGFPINYDSSEDDPDQKDVVVMRHSDYLLEDTGDGAEADLLGTTPPRQRQRSRLTSKPRNRVTFGANTSRAENSPGRLKKDLKIQRKLAREEMDGIRADSLPHTDTALPTLVESCNRFMSLTSRLKCREAAEAEEPVERRWPAGGPPGGGGIGDEPPESRVTFHKIFSTLINMGNIEKGCRRTISREEQVWQNELKDLIWLELQAKLAGRTLAQQDAFLCAQRKVVPAIVQNIRDYRFVNPQACRARSRPLGAIAGSSENLRDLADVTGHSDDETSWTCVSLSCRACSRAIGKALRELRTLLDSFANAHALYPSSKALTVDHPLVATQLFQNRIKAMCLWYNTALHLRLKALAVRRMLRTMHARRNQPPRLAHLASTDSDASRQSDSRQCTVQFNLNSTPTDSNNSDSSHSDHKAVDDSCDDNASDGHTDDKNRVGNKVADEGKEDVKETDEGNDEVDRVRTTSDYFDETGATTPEIIISDKYGTTDTVSSSESGYTSAEEPQAQADAVCDLGSLDDLTQLRLLGKCDVSPYRTYHQEMLKTQGVRRCMQFMNKMRMNVLHRVHLTLEKPHSENKTEPHSDETVEVFDDTKEEESTSEAGDEEERRAYELRRYGCWSEECLSMRLPSYRSHLLLLSCICMEAVHDYLEMRLEDRPLDPSCLTVKQLIHELKEGLDIATETRAAYVRDIGVVLAGGRAGPDESKDLLLVIRTFDATVETVLKQYLSYVRTMSQVEHLGRACLQREWSFTARLARRHRAAVQLAPQVFSEVACNQLERIRKQFELKFQQLDEEDQSAQNERGRHAIYALCRSAQAVYASERDAALQAAQWARALAARLARAPPPSYRKERGAIFERLMELRDCVVLCTREIVSRSHDDAVALPADADADAVAARVRELLLQAHRLGFELHKELYRFAQGPFMLQDEKTKKRPASLQPIRAQHAAANHRRRPETMLVNEPFNPMIHKELHRFVNEPSRFALPRRTMSNAGAVGDLSRLARARFSRSESIGEDVETTGFDFGDGQRENSIELLLSGEHPPEQPSTTTGADCAEERVWAERVARAVVEYARCWMHFVVERCDAGRGLRPRWASQGLEFLMLACDPCNTKHLSEAEFERLKREMDGCISHVIGTRPAPRSDSVSKRPSRGPLHSPLPLKSERISRPSSLVEPASPPAADTSPPAPPLPPLPPLPPAPPSEPDPLLSFDGLESAAHNSRIISSISALEAARDDKLRSLQAVGRVLAAPVNSYEPKLRQLKFKWQRGLKIGAGTFGKVYTVVNTESGQLLAMKEVSVAPNDRRALQKAANELRVLEGVIHPHLVRYYGCELHREEMLLFMELCVEGSLEALVVTSGALAEPTVRRYTKQLTSAVAELHCRGIAHRDIKSGNIFLTNEGHCLKLGDFGCAVKIRANTTAAGELQGCVGTQAYMAPEVFMKSSGHGRAADVWSLGCVVTEMASGKRPFSEYDSNYQIMFVVGMGGRPQIPSTLSSEGQAFCLACLTHEPEDRPRAEQLSLHHFLMVKSDDDCECQAGYLKA